MKEVNGISLLFRVELRPYLLHVLQTSQKLGFWIRKILSDGLSGVAPSLIYIIRKSPRPAPAPPGSVAIAQVPWIGQNAGEALRDHKNVCRSVFHFFRVH